MNPQPDAWVGALGMFVLVIGTMVAIKVGVANAKNNPNPNPSPRNWDMFELGEVFDKPYYKPSPTNLMREIDTVRRKNHGRKI